MEVSLTLGFGALGVAAAGFMTSTGFAVRAFFRWLLQRRWERAETEHIAQAWDEAERIDAVVEDLRELDRKVHYRHNIHCHVCGRFARQAEGLPPGVADCTVHGLGLRTPPATGAIPVIVLELPASVGELFPEPPGFELSLIEAADPLEELEAA